MALTTFFTKEERHSVHELDIIFNGCQWLTCLHINLGKVTATDFECSIPHAAMMEWVAALAIFLNFSVPASIAKTKKTKISWAIGIIEAFYIETKTLAFKVGFRAKMILGEDKTLF